ncbi:DUF262 domain-containing HNH endonuclease family protein [Microbacterium invictum]|uniref:DUF262 domain-containing HNH endonuclease family protein n=1 Tax=Microbacterium invictum TaxID=515415 RepID=A0ABZ0VII9_9MICO|nr:DUF262 domain-containing HNH endonuclease family protein [Microbacterium invictum]WQB71602.1 DUF262 domain-containing HNH endonuclease family protein [Microbacterium invictum]
MPDIDFQPEKRSVEDLYVGADYYVIPRFQRPYSWEATNLDDFWRDIVFDNSVGYFIGPMVAWRESGSPIRRLVDGQQRLTTISIMFAVIRDELKALGEETLAAGVHRYLEKYDRSNELQFTLQTEVSSPFLSQAIFKYPANSAINPATEEEVALSQALAQVRRLITEELGKRQDPLDWLLELRDRILGLKVIWIEHSNEDDAYIIFETLNSRGKDLEVVDLLKNHLLARLRGNGNAAADTYRATWEKLRDRLESTDSRVRIDANRFILHWWLSQEDYVAQRKLFRAIKAKVNSEPLAEARLNSLVRDAALYRKVVEPSGVNWATEVSDAGRSLSALALFGIVQPAPLLLSLMRAREASPKLGAAHFKKTLQTIERFHFQRTVVSQLSSSGGVSEMYAKAARELYLAGTDQSARVRVLNDLRAKLIDRKPDREQFLLAFEERFLFTDDFTRDSKLVRYVLSAFLRAAHPTTGLDNLTIEHIMSQAKIGNGESMETVGSLGNLLLVSEAVNQKLGSKTFEAKKAVLKRVGSAYDIGGVVDQANWSASEITARTRMLAERAHDVIWKLPV